MNQGQLVGYARVSSVGQSLDVQVEKLKDYGCFKFYREKKSGSSVNNRSELKSCLDYLREGDTLVITKLDRLARSTLDLAKILDDLERRGIGFVVLDQDIDTTTPTGKLLFTMLAAIAEFETGLRAERQREGIDKAKNNGVKFGAKLKLSNIQMDEIVIKRENGSIVSELADEYDVSSSTINRVIRARKEAKELAE